MLAVFARQPISSECMGWLRMIADHAAAAITTARAFAEIEALHKRLELENEYLREEVTGTGAFGELIGQSPALEAMVRQIDLVAPTDSAVLILGESGTGKELSPGSFTAAVSGQPPADQGQLRRGTARAIRERVFRARSRCVYRGPCGTGSAALN